MTALIQNPVLPGFHPDPSICRVGEDYYIANSTFQWWPGVRIHHSRDLVHWRHAAYACTRRSQLDLTGRVDSGGVWAPALSYAQGRFWLVYSDVRTITGPYRDVRNCLITAESIEGPWSEPIVLSGEGFDASLFHDDDGRHWYVHPRWLHLPGRSPFDGIWLQEYDHAQGRLVGAVQRIFDGSPLGCTEGPHLYKKEGWYYLLTAEAGTFFEHAASIARSRRIDGPYEVMPGNPLITAWHSPRTELQRTGHASLVETPNGDWYLAYLCGRPNEWADAPPEGQPDYAHAHCTLGRETGIARIEWDLDGWPRLAGGGQQPPRTLASTLPAHPWPAEPVRDDFDGDALSPHWNTLRVPMDSTWLSLQERPGHLRLTGRESLFSPCEQSLVGRRLQHHRVAASTRLDFEPQHCQQMAGLAAYYDSRNHVYLYVSSHPETRARELRVMQVRNGVYTEPVPPQALEPGAVELGMDFDTTRLRLRWRQAGRDWTPLGEALPCFFLSDEYAMQRVEEHYIGFGFTGTYLALACQDLAGTRIPADFAHFDYEPRP